MRGKFDGKRGIVTLTGDDISELGYEVDKSNPPCPPEKPGVSGLQQALGTNAPYGAVTFSSADILAQMGLDFSSNQVTLAKIAIFISAVAFFITAADTIWQRFWPDTKIYDSLVAVQGNSHQALSLQRELIDTLERIGSSAERIDALQTESSQLKGELHDAQAEILRQELVIRELAEELESLRSRFESN